MFSLLFLLFFFFFFLSLICVLLESKTRSTPINICHAD